MKRSGAVIPRRKAGTALAISCAPLPGQIQHLSPRGQPFRVIRHSLEQFANLQQFEADLPVA
jgi:hypothetical protein